MWQFSQAVEGLADGCLELGIPVTGGNVSFYNQTGDVPIHPTPVVAVLGTIDDVARRVPSGWQDPGDNIYLLGTTALELDGSAWAGTVHGHLGGRPPGRRPAAREGARPNCSPRPRTRGSSTRRTTSPTAASRRRSSSRSLRFGVGVRVFLDDVLARDGVDLATALFSESTGRAIVAVPREEDVKFTRLCEGRGYPVLRIGVTDAGGPDGGAVEVQDSFVLPLEELRSGYRGAMSEAFGPVVGQR